MWERPDRPGARLMLEFKCLLCGFALYAEDTAAGKMIPCSKCGQKIKIPIKLPGQKAPKSSKAGAALSSAYDDDRKARKRIAKATDDSSDVPPAYVPSGRFAIQTFVWLPLASAIGGVVTWLIYSIGTVILGFSAGIILADIIAFTEGEKQGIVEAILRKLAVLSALAGLAVMVGGIAVPAHLAIAASRSGKNRSRFVAGCGAASGLLLALAFRIAGWAYLAQYMEENPQLAARWEAGPLLEEYVFYVYIFELVVLFAGAIAAFVYSFNGLAEQYFCEKCGEYLAEPQTRHWPMGVAHEISAPIKADDLRAFLAWISDNPAVEVYADDPSVRLDIHCCATCGRALINVVDIFYAKANDENKKTQERRTASCWVSKKTARLVLGSIDN